MEVVGVGRIDCVSHWFENSRISNGICRNSMDARCGDELKMWILTWTRRPASWQTQ
jgi:hypothetical protein